MKRVREEAKEGQKLVEVLEEYRWEERLEGGVEKRKIEVGSNEDADSKGEEWR